MKQNEGFWIMLENLVHTSEIIMDRPKDTTHPRYPERIYPANYGYLNNTASMDNDGIDVWIGSCQNKDIDAIICVIDVVKRDSEIKILIGCTDEEKDEIYRFHNSTDGMRGIMICR